MPTTNSKSQSKRVLFAYSLLLVWVLDLVILRDWLKKSKKWGLGFCETMFFSYIKATSYGFMQGLIILSGTTSTSVVQSTTAGSGGRRGQAIKSEAHTTTTGGRPRSHKRQMMQHRIHENNNQVSRLKKFTTHCSLTNIFFGANIFKSF